MIQDIGIWLRETLGDPKTYGADSWVEVFYWLGGVVLAIIALLALWHRVLQARAGFLLELDNRWYNLAEPRRKLTAILKAITKEALEKQAHMGDKHRLKDLPKMCKEAIDDMPTENPMLYDEIVEYLGFFETVGVMVRHRYVPLRDMVRMYKGPILDIDTMFTLHIKEWQKRANVPEGLFENLLYLIKRTRRREWLKSRILFWK